MLTSGGDAQGSRSRRERRKGEAEEGRACGDGGDWGTGGEPLGRRYEGGREGGRQEREGPPGRAGRPCGRPGKEPVRVAAPTRREQEARAASGAAAAAGHVEVVGRGGGGGRSGSGAHEIAVALGFLAPSWPSSCPSC